MKERLRIFTWHVHGSYLYYLAHIPHDIYIPVNATRTDGYAGRTTSYPWPDNVIEVPSDEVKDLELDCLLFQSQRNFLRDQHQILTPEQRELPKLYLEHDPPRESPTDTRHLIQSPDILLVHVTPFNELMWDAVPHPLSSLTMACHSLNNPSIQGIWNAASQW